MADQSFDAPFSCFAVHNVTIRNLLAAHAHVPPGSASEPPGFCDEQVVRGRSQRKEMRNAGREKSVAIAAVLFEQVI
jgi:hypothetical protein